MPQLGEFLLIRDDGAESEIPLIGIARNSTAAGPLWLTRLDLGKKVVHSPDHTQQLAFALSGLSLTCECCLSVETCVCGANRTGRLVSKPVPSTVSKDKSSAKPL